MIDLKKEKLVPDVSLDVLKLIESVTKEVVKLVDASFYTSGALHESNSIKNLQNIRGQMFALYSMVQSTKNPS